MPADSWRPTTCGGQARITGGSFEPLFSDSKESNVISVSDYFLDIRPVTNAEFYEFICQIPQWQKDRTPSVFVDSGYLSHWSRTEENECGTLAPSAKQQTQPVTNISWFAAKNYCAWKQLRLPTVAEWEYAALAGDQTADGRKEPKYLEKILQWYSSPSADQLPEICRKAPNYWKIHDLHGLVWEWVSDFNSSLVTGESRGDSGLERDLFCGAGAAAVTEQQRLNYPAFMRYAFRSSLGGKYTINNLGFRCAKTWERNKK